jgi:hypothetical protein
VSPERLARAHSRLGRDQYKGKRTSSHRLRWRVAGTRHHRTFATAKLAESFRATLLVASRQGQPFDVRSRLPADLAAKEVGPSWVDHAAAFVDMKWPHVSPRHRKGLAEGLAAATLAMHPDRSRQEASQARRVLTNWVFNTSARNGAPIAKAAPPEGKSQIVARLRCDSPEASELAKPQNLRPVLEALSLKLDGTPSSPSTATRKRSALFSSLDYAVEIGLLAANPMERLNGDRRRARRSSTAARW